MKFYTKSHAHFCGIDLHARCLYVCILDASGEPCLHKKISASPQALLKIITPYLDDLVIGVECMFSWYWVADFCEDHDIPFILGHALYMRAIHGGKAKNDKIDSLKIACLYVAGCFLWLTYIPDSCEEPVICCAGGSKIGNAYLKLAFSEAAVLFLRKNTDAQAWLEKKSNQYNKAKALTILAHKLDRTVYFMLKRKVIFNQEQFLTG